MVEPVHELETLHIGALFFAQPDNEPFGFAEHLVHPPDLRSLFVIVGLVDTCCINPQRGIQVLSEIQKCSLKVRVIDIEWPLH